MVLSVLEDKNFEENLRENDKKLIGNLDRSKRVRKAFLKTFEIVKNMCIRPQGASQKLTSSDCTDLNHGVDAKGSSYMMRETDLGPSVYCIIVH